MKYLWSCESMSRLHISLWMISNMSELLLALLFNLLVCFPLMQSTQVLKLVKWRLLNISSFTNILILSMEICLNHQCYKIEESSLITHLLMLVLLHVRTRHDRTSRSRSSHFVVWFKVTKRLRWTSLIWNFKVRNWL
jgi:hypothetical protein